MGKGGSQGILDKLQGLKPIDTDNKNIAIQEYSNTETQEYVNTRIQDEKIKRTYKLKNSTVLKLGEMKVLFYPPATELSDIVDEAIRMLYESKKQLK